MQSSPVYAFTQKLVNIPNTAIGRSKTVIPNKFMHTLGVVV